MKSPVPVAAAAATDAKSPLFCPKPRRPVAPLRFHQSSHSDAGAGMDLLDLLLSKSPLFCPKPRRPVAPLRFHQSSHSDAGAGMDLLDLLLSKVRRRCSDLTSKGVRLRRKRRQEDASKGHGNLSALEDRFKRRISPEPSNWQAPMREERKMVYVCRPGGTTHARHHPSFADLRDEHMRRRRKTVKVIHLGIEESEHLAKERAAAVAKATRP
uniref:Uncharacterized protein n=1 Tax=Aegilops tauschii TaxID=37682 RepID=M8CL35_AEGTA